MKNLIYFLSVAFIFAFTPSCEKDIVQQELSQENSSELKSASQAKNAKANRPPVPLNFRTHLSGAEEVPANNSKATGQAIFQVSKDGQSMSYKLIVANIENVRMAHIHLAPAGANGPVVLWLYPSSPPAALIPGRTNGILHQGTVTKANLVGQLSGEELEALVEHIKNGNAYVNVHTSQFPPGEIRGQIWGNVR